MCVCIVKDGFIDLWQCALDLKSVMGWKIMLMRMKCAIDVAFFMSVDVTEAIYNWVFSFFSSRDVICL
jgi:hypothetical protein